MLKRFSATWLLGSWFFAVGVIVVWSVAMDARLSTSALLFVVGASPALVMFLIGLGAPPPTVAEILHAVHTENGHGRAERAPATTRA